MRDALETSCPARERTRLKQYQGVSSLPNEHELTLHRDYILRFVRELEDVDMTVDELRLHLEDYQ